VIVKLDGLRADGGSQRVFIPGKGCEFEGGGHEGLLEMNGGFPVTPVAQNRSRAATDEFHISLCVSFTIYDGL